MSIVCDAIRSDPVKRAHFLDLSRQADEQPEPVAYPGVATMARTAVKAVAGFIATGGAMVDQDEYDRRRGICADCEHLDAARDRCKKCGCYLAVKPWLAREHCPINKW